MEWRERKGTKRSPKRLIVQDNHFYIRKLKTTWYIKSALTFCEHLSTSFLFPIVPNYSWNKRLWDETWSWRDVSGERERHSFKNKLFNLQIELSNLSEPKNTKLDYGKHFFCLCVYIMFSKKKYIQIFTRTNELAHLVFSV